MTAVEEDNVKYTIQYKSDLNINDQLFEILKSEKIISLTHKEVTLEDVYIKLVEDEKRS